MKTALVLTACGSILVASWCCVSLRSGSVEPAGPDRAVIARPAPGVLDALERRFDRTAESTRTDERPASIERELTDDDLFARLRATSRAFLEHDESGLTSNLEALLATPRTPRRVLELLLGGRLATQSAEFVGATVATGFAVAHAGRRNALALDGRPFVRDFLEALARFELETGEPVAEFTASLSVDGRPAVGARWIGTIVDLRAQVGAHAENFDALLRNILTSLVDVELETGDLPALALIVSNSSDALAVQAALSVLLKGDPMNYVPIAEDLLAQSSQAPELGAAIVSAIAQHAPVDTAAESLARVADGEHYGQFARFGTRPGALAAAQKEYNALLAANLNPLARKMLVSSMGADDERVLIGIAEIDTDASVRGQALLTLTQRPVESPAVMSTVRAQHGARGAAANGMSTATSLMIAENVVLHGTPATRSDAIAWLRAVATDPNESLDDRRAAWTKLRARAEPMEIEGIEPPH